MSVRVAATFQPGSLPELLASIRLSGLKAEATPASQGLILAVAGSVAVNVEAGDTVVASSSPSSTTVEVRVRAVVVSRLQVLEVAAAAAAMQVVVASAEPERSFPLPTVNQRQLAASTRKKYARNQAV